MFPQVHNNNTNIRKGLMEILQAEEHSSTIYNPARVSVLSFGGHRGSSVHKIDDLCRLFEVSEH